MGMLIAGFTLLVMMPAFILLPGMLPRPAEQPSSGLLVAALSLGCLLGVPAAILVVLDRLSKRVVASHPGKFGPKVPSVNKAGG
jgi:hypothetical protein